MKSYSKIFVSALLIIFTVTVSAQKDFQGQAYYFSKTTMDMDNFGGRQMSEQQKKQIAERMKGMFEKTFILTFNKEESIYKEEERLDAPGGGGGMRFGMSMGGGNEYKNVKENNFMRVIFTNNEGGDFSGANKLNSRYLNIDNHINLDWSDFQGKNKDTIIFTNGSAGFAVHEFSRNISFTGPKYPNAYEVTISGLTEELDFNDQIKAYNNVL